MLENISMNRNLSHQAHLLFRRAEWLGWLHRLWAWLTRRPHRLTNLNEQLHRQSFDGAYDAGLQTIPIERIRGTESKETDFDAGFHPTQERTRDRWLNIARLILSGRDLPPVELIQLGDDYFVRDGHHRISVSRSLGQNYIDAEVTVMYLANRVTKLS